MTKVKKIIPINAKKKPFIKHIIPNQDVKKTTIIAILSYIILGAVSYMPGIFAVPLAAGLAGGKTTIIVELATGYLVGRVLGYFSSGIIIKVFGGRKSASINLFILFVTSTLIAILGWSANPNVVSIPILTFYTIAITIGGWASGNGMGASVYLLVATYKSRNKATMWLNVGNGIYGLSVAAMAFGKGALKNFFKANTTFFTWIYLAIGIILLVFSISIWLIKVKEDNAFNSIHNFKKNFKRSNLQKPKVNLDVKTFKLVKKSFWSNSVNLLVVLGGVAMLMYSFGEKNATFFWPWYFKPSQAPITNLPITDAGVLIGIFWTFVSVFRLLIGVYVAKKVKDEYLVIGLASIALIGYFLFIIAQPAHSAVLFYLGAVTIGIGLSAIYPTIISYSYSHTTNVSSMTSGTLSGLANIGGILCTLLSPSIATMTGFKFMPTLFAGILFALLIALILFIMWLKKHKIKVGLKKGVFTKDIKMIIKQSEKKK